METNLLYIFINREICSSLYRGNKTTGSTYDELPDYYNITYNHNKEKFTNSVFIKDKNAIKDLIEDSDFKYVNNIINTKWLHLKEMMFWYITVIRVVLLCIYIKKYNLKNVLHVEADSLIFANNFESLVNNFNNGEFGYPNEGRFKAAPAIMFFKDSTSADNLLKLYIKLLEKGERALQPYTGHMASCISDMALLSLISRGEISTYKLLPCLPYGEQSVNFNKFQYIFDPISYGQFLGGTNGGASIGYKDDYHYVGQEIIKKKISVVFNKSPFVIYNDINIPIFNLHIHNKEAILKFI